MLQFVGKASLDETKVFHAILARRLAERGRCYLLIDLGGLTAIGADSRRFIGEWNREHKITAGAAFGASFAVRVMVTLLLTTIKLMNRDPPEVFIARDEAEARRWLAAQQAARSRGEA